MIKSRAMIWVRYTARIGANKLAHFMTEYMNGRDHLVDLGGDGRILLKQILNSVWTETHLAQDWRPAALSYEHGMNLRVT
jgi:hypothetical protein